MKSPLSRDDSLDLWLEAGAGARAWHDRKSLNDGSPQGRHSAAVDRPLTWLYP